MIRRIVRLVNKNITVFPDKEKHYAEKDRVRVVGYATDDNRELMLHLSDGNRIAVGKSDKSKKAVNVHIRLHLLITTIMC